MSGSGGDDTRELRRELAEARDTLRAVIGGEVDAVVGERSPVMLRAAQQALRESEEMFRAVFRGSRDAMVIADDEGRYVDCNPAATTLYGAERRELLGTRVHDWAAGEEVDEHWAEFLELDGEARGYFALRRDDGEVRLCEYAATRDILPGRHLSILRDVTEEKRLQRQVQMAQKMEAVGRLAGGIAHDFNNLLTTITMVAGHVHDVYDEVPGLAEEIDVILGAARRAGELTRQLLAVGRRQAGRPEPLDLARTVEGMHHLLERTLGEPIELRCDFGPEAAVVQADRSQVEQVILNLAVNARDAMPEGGVLTVVVQAGLGEGAVAVPPEVEPAPSWVRLRVEDTGVGMDESTLERAFEPFFSTKRKDRGTGLGLSMVYGIVAHAGGFVTVDSAAGEGTAIDVYLPERRGASAAGELRDRAGQVSGGAETVLLVEDEDAVRTSLGRALARQGYRVLTCRGGDEALAVLDAHEGPVDLVLTDVVMPEMTGPELVRGIRGRGVEAAVLYVTGHAADAFDGDTGEAAILRKPFHPATLLQRVRDLLDG